MRLSQFPQTSAFITIVEPQSEFGVCINLLSSEKRWGHFSARYPFALGAKIPYLIFSRFSFLRNTVIFLTRSYGTGLPKGNCTVPLDPLNRESSFLKASTPLAVGKNET